MFKGKKISKPQGRVQKAKSLNIRKQRVAKRTPAEKRPRPGLARAWRLTGRLSLAAVLWAATTAGLLGAYVFLASSPGFRVQSAEVSGTRHLSRLEVLRAAGIGAHSNLLSMNVGKVEKRLDGLDWVRRAEFKRILPHGVLIKVEEHDPYILALVDGRFHYLDADLKPFARMKNEPAPDLPVLTGLSRADLVEPDEEVKRLLLAAGRLLEALSEKTPAEAGFLSEVHLDRVWGLSLVLSNLPATVRLGFEQPKKRLEDLKLVVDDLKRRGELKRATLIDLDAGSNIVVRFGGEAV